VNEIEISFHSIELSIFYNIDPKIGLNILYIYHFDEEISCYLNFYAVSEIKQAIWEHLDSPDTLSIANQ
jgi:hypothetical protein